MISTDALYLPVPAENTRLGPAYRLRVIAMIGGLFVFLALHLHFIAAAGLLAYGLIVLPVPDFSGPGILLILVFKLGGAFAAVLLCLFLFKGLFKGA